jgi:deoxyribonuclease-4
MTHKLGAHLSAAGGYDKPLESIVKKGGNCLQLFSCSPRSWADANITDEQIAIFLQKKEELQIDPIYFHACYLINLADTAQIGEKSCNSLIKELTLASKLHIKGSIVHTGSLKEKEGIRNKDTFNGVTKNIKKILSETPEDTFLILENAGNRKIGKDLQDLADILGQVDNPRVRICLDTCHLHAAGYDLRTSESFEAFLQDFDKKIGLNKLEVIHANDSRDPFSSLRDRHENIGKGEVGINVFTHLLNHPQTKHLPFIIETPGFDDKGPDKANLDILKSLIK